MGKKTKKVRGQQIKKNTGFKSIRTKCAQTLLDSTLYLLVLGESEVPFLVDNKLVLLYSDEETAKAAAQSFSGRYGTDSVRSLKVKDNSVMFKMMWNYGTDEFIVDGDGDVYNVESVFLFKGQRNNLADRERLLGLQPTESRRFFSRKLVIKDWFSNYSRASFICGIIACSLANFTNHSNGALPSDAVTVCIGIAGIVLGFIAISGASKKKVNPEFINAFGMILCVIAIFTSMVYLSA